MKIMTVVGTRPQFIKAAVVSHAMRAAKTIDEVLVHTGQHYDDGMSSVFFSELRIPRPAVNLDVGSGSHAQQTASMMTGLEKLLLDYRPDAVMVYGDTNSTLAAALVSSKLNIRLVHVESGVRLATGTLIKTPEEINRIVTDHLSDILFAPTPLARDNLLTEGIVESRIFLVGDVMYDAVLRFLSVAERNSQIIEQLSLRDTKYVLATVHRPENTDNPRRLRAICNAVSELAKKYTVVFPLHPRTRVALEQIDVDLERVEGLIPTQPVGYLDMLSLEKNARLIVTDSGGVQREGFFLGVPIVLLREYTSWKELVDLGWVSLVPPKSHSAIVEECVRALDSGKRGTDNPFGDGHASAKIVSILQAKLAKE